MNELPGDIERFRRRIIRSSWFSVFILGIVIGCVITFLFGKTVFPQKDQLNLLNLKELLKKICLYLSVGGYLTILVLRIIFLQKKFYGKYIFKHNTQSRDDRYIIKNVIYPELMNFCVWISIFISLYFFKLNEIDDFVYNIGCMFFVFLIVHFSPHYFSEIYYTLKIILKSDDRIIDKTEYFKNELHVPLLTFNSIALLSCIGLSSIWWVINVIMEVSK